MFGWLFGWLRGTNDKRERDHDISRQYGENPLVWSRKTESVLFHRFRLWTQRTGTSKNAVGHHGRRLPAALMPEQAGFVFGFESTRSKRQRIEGPTLDRPETDRDIVFSDLAMKGFIVGSACRYGGDFVVYADHPSKCHSSDTIRVVEADEQLSCADLAGFCRVQGSVLKRAVLAAVHPETREPSYFSFSFNAPLSTEAFKKVERRLSRIITQTPEGGGSRSANSRFTDSARGMTDLGDETAVNDDEFGIQGAHDEFELALHQNGIYNDDEDDDHGECAENDADMECDYGDQ